MIDSGVIKVESFHKPDWTPLPREGCRNVEVRVLIYEEGRFAMSMLRFGKDGTIDEHPGESPAEVFCLDGAGYVSVGDATSPLAPGQRIDWPKGVNHRLWTEDDGMQVLIVHRQPNE